MSYTNCVFKIDYLQCHPAFVSHYIQMVGFIKIPSFHWHRKRERPFFRNVFDDLCQVLVPKIMIVLWSSSQQWTMSVLLLSGVIFASPEISEMYSDRIRLKSGRENPGIVTRIRKRIFSATVTVIIIIILCRASTAITVACSVTAGRGSRKFSATGAYKRLQQCIIIKYTVTKV